MPSPSSPPSLPAGLYKAGGSATSSHERLLQCLEAAKLRGKEVRDLLWQALDAADTAALS